MAVKYPGLLVPEADKHQALYQGLLGMGSALSGGPSNAPVSFAQQLGRGGQSFNKSYQDRINQSKQDQMGNQKYQMQQAQMEAQKMKIEEAKRQQAEAARKKLITDRFRAQQQYGGFEPGSMDAANYQSGLSPEQQMLNELNPVEQAKSGISTAAALAKERRVNAQQEKMERIKAGSKLLESQGIKPKDIMALERTASKEVQNELAPQIDRVRGYRQMEAIFANPEQALQTVAGQTASIDGTVFDMTGQGAADMALIFSFMKMQDPRSVVREGEFDMAAKTSGVTSQVANMIGKVARGDRLGAEERKALMRQARSQYNAADLEIGSRIEQEKDRFNKYGYKGLDADRAFGSVYTPYDPRFAASSLRKGGSALQPGSSPHLSNLRAVPAGAIPTDLVPTRSN